MRSAARAQHHVPQMLQDAFATPGKGKKSQVHVFDKQEARTFRTSPENVLQERDFNTFEDGGITYCLEGGMGDVEDRAAPILKVVIGDRSLANLSDDQRAALCIFAALQRLRGVATRASMLDLDQALRERLRADGDDPDNIPQLQGSDDPKQVKLTALRLVGENLPAFAASFADKDMLLIAAAPGATFLLGDTPVVLANQTDTRPYGNLGLQVRGIEIYLPVAPDLLLAFWCPSIRGSLEAELEAARTNLRKSAALALVGVGLDAARLRETRERLLDWVKKVETDVAAMNAKTPIASSPENMDYYNSLQVIHAERYLLSAAGDFALVRRMLADNQRYRQGVRWEIA